MILKICETVIFQVVHDLDGLRKHPPKFVCINDDTDPLRTKDNEYVATLLLDFMESVLPVPSSFELPQEYRNRYVQADAFMPGTSFMYHFKFTRFFGITYQSDHKNDKCLIVI